MSVSETPSLAQLLREYADMVVGRLSVSLPGEVVSYDGATQSALVQPSPRGRRRVPDSAELVAFDLPQVADVPVLWPSWAGGTAGVVGVLQPGDPVLLVICDRSIDEWKQAVDAPYTPRDVRRCNLSDAMCFPGGRPPSTPLDASARPLVGDAANTMVVRGTIKMGSSAAADRVVTEARLLAALADLVTKFNAHTHIASGTPTGTAASSTPPIVMTTPAANSLSTSDVRAT